MLNLETNEIRELSGITWEGAARRTVVRKAGEMIRAEELMRWRVVWIGLRGGFEVWRIGANGPLFKVWMDPVADEDG
jgi:hypothetical protein